MSRTIHAAVASLTAAVCATVALGHEEDWRKLADQLQPNFGEIYRNHDANNPMAVSFDPNANGMTLLSQIPLNQFSSGGGGADIWGFTTATGREIAIIGKGNGHGFADITDPINPVIIGFVPSANSMWHDVKVIGDYAYAVNESGNGIQVIDISDADNGNINYVKDVTQGGHFTTHNIIANENSGWLYICGANVGNGGLIAVDVSDPENPTFAGSWTTRYVHDAQVVNMTVGPFAGREIAFCFSGGAGIDILDVTNKSNITRLGGSSYPQIAYCHQGWLSEDQQWLYVNDELDEGSLVSVTTTRVFRIFDPDYSGPAQNEPSLTNPVLVGTFTTGLPAIDHNLYTREGIIYQANYRSGLRVFDATQNPANPVEIASYDTFPGSDSANFNGAWSVYPYFPSETIVVSDIESGLFVLRLDVGPTASSIALDIQTDLPDKLGPGEPLTVTATATTNNAVIDSDGVRLVYSSGDNPQTTLQMTPTGNPDEFTATIPGQDCFETIEFRITSTSTEGKDFASPLNTVEVFEDEIFIADGETNPAAWTPSSTADTGDWEFGVPANGDRADPPTDADGTNLAWLTENAVGNSDVDNGSVSLTTEVYDLSLGGEITYAYWYNDTAGGAAGAEDFYRVEVQINGGSWQIARNYTTTAPQWRTDRLTFGDAADFPAAASVRLRFTAADFSPGDVIEGGLDAFLVLRKTCTDPVLPCPTDLDGSGDTNLADLLQLLAAFGMSADGDTDDDGDTDLTDLLSVLAEFGNSCPS